ncbi:MAG: hypothetical protein HZB92_06985 [Euryarchaeota archaeon]|nr:hypothetical protein [Euryarchaeota archaeon]
MEKKEWLYRIQPTRPGMLSEGPTEEEGRIVGEHFLYLKKLTAKGVVLLAGRTLNIDPSSFGIVIYLAENEKEAKRIFEEDPAVRAGVFKGEVYPYKIALAGKSLLQ